MKLIKSFSIILILLFISKYSLAENLDFRINYGISNHSTPVSNVLGTSTFDDDDQGFLLSVGSNIGSWWGVEAIYYDIGESSVKGSKNDTIKVDDAVFQFESAGTIKRGTDGYGFGAKIFIAPTEGFLDTSGYIRLGIHSWEHSGSSTLLWNDNAFKSFYYNDGTDLYFGLGIDLGITDNTSLNFAYDSLGFSDSVGEFGDESSLLSIGLKATF